MRRRTFLLGAMGAMWLTAQESVQARESLAYLTGDGLWIRDLPDGRPQRVARGAPGRVSPGMEWLGIASPRISPSGQWIAYQENGWAYVVSRSGEPQPSRIGEGATQWRTGHEELLLEQTRGLSVFTAANGWAGPVRTIPEAALPVVFSPDGGELVYGRRTKEERGTLCRLDADAALPPRSILSRAGDGLIPYAWIGNALWYWMDPDFSGSAESDGLALFRVPPAGGAPQPAGVTTLVRLDFLALSPAGDRLAVTAGDDRRSWCHKRIALIDRASGALRDLTGESTVAICPSWSPDGSRIVFSALPSGGEELWGSEPARLFLGKRRIWAIGAKGGSEPVQLTNDDRYRDEEPIWLADGRHILFCRIERGTNAFGARSIWLMDDRGGALTRIAGPLQTNDTFEGEYWFGYYGTIDWRRVMDYHRRGN